VNISKTMKRMYGRLKPDQAGLVITISPGNMPSFSRWLADASAEKLIETLDIELSTGLVTRRKRHDVVITFTPGLNLEYLDQKVGVRSVESSAPSGRISCQLLVFKGTDGQRDTPLRQ